MEAHALKRSSSESSPVEADVEEPPRKPTLTGDGGGDGMPSMPTAGGGGGNAVLGELSLDEEPPKPSATPRRVSISRVDLA